MKHTITTLFAALLLLATVGLKGKSCYLPDENQCAKRYETHTDRYRESRYQYIKEQRERKADLARDARERRSGALYYN